MGLFYGTFGNIKSKQTDSLETKLSWELDWTDATKHQIREPDLNVDFLLHKNFLKDRSDLFYSDLENNNEILVTGHIYNKEELLDYSGTEENNISDPELVGGLFNRLGKDFAELINGDFIILIYLKNRNSLLIYRDHLGIRPVSYALQEETLWFSSDGLSLSKALFGDKEIDNEFLLNYVRHSDEIDINLLPNKNVKKLLPGHFLEYTPGGDIRIEKYWHPERIKEKKELSFLESRQALKNILEDAVALRSTPELLAGCHLSGGLDSGLIAALAKEKYTGQNSFPGFSWSPGKSQMEIQKDDERLLAEATAEKLDIDLVFTDFNKEGFLQMMRNWKYINGYYDEIVLRKNAKQKNIKLIFSGWGGDEFASINSRGINSDLIFKFQWRLFLKRYKGKSPLQLFKIIIASVLIPALGINYRRLKGEWELYRDYIFNRKDLYNFKHSLLHRYCNRREVHLGLLKYGHLSERTEEWFINAYPKGIEYRFPLLDKKVIEFMLSVPSKLLVRDGYVRLLLRDLGNGILPDEITWSKSKQEPARHKKMMMNFEEVYHEIKAEIPNFKKNPYLKFVNFKQLEKDIKKGGKYINDTDFENTIYFTITLKQLHEFTTGYAS